MSLLGFVQAAPVPPRTISELQFQVQDALSAGGRLWVRGRILAPLHPVLQLSSPRWWKRWRGREVSADVPLLAHIETHIGGKVCTTYSPVRPDGQFDATWATELPAPRRGWRVARNRVSFCGHAAEACTVVLALRPDAVRALAVLLPSALTLPRSSLGRGTSLELLAPYAPVLHRLAQGGTQPSAIYYLACVPFGGESLQAELALALSASGWPAGQFVLSFTDREPVPAVCERALDRLRWLLAGTCELQLLNLDPAAERSVAAASKPMDDRAPVTLVTTPPSRGVRPAEEPETAPAREPAPRRPEPGRLSPGPRPSRSSRVTRYPLVFCHGMLGYRMLRMQLPENLNSFAPLEQFLRERGFRALFPQVSPTSGVADRARQLRDQIRRWTDEPINLIAHSMGGLDARYLITHLDMGDRVRSLTTISTPHRGSYLADWFLANYRDRVPLLLAFEAFGVNVDGFRACRPAVCREFNATTPDVPGVSYFSYGGDVPPGRVTPVLRRVWNLLTAVEGPNDGMVSLTSARWGEYLGTLAVDHFAQTPDGTFVRPGEDFDALGFYARLVQDLARRGF
jgi:triacylglycerol lipase